MAKKFFDRGGKRYAGFGGLAGAGIYGIELLVAPEAIFALMNHITAFLTPYLGTMLSSFIGTVLPALSLICGAAILAAGIFYVIKPDPVVQAAKLGVNLIKHAAGGFIPGGKGTIDALEDIGAAALNAM
jgi:hypothetical protein